MSFKDMVNADIHGVFLNAEEFADKRTVLYDGKTDKETCAIKLVANDSMFYTITNEDGDVKTRMLSINQKFRDIEVKYTDDINDKLLVDVAYFTFDSDAGKIYSICFNGDKIDSRTVDALAKVNKLLFVEGDYIYYEKEYSDVFILNKNYFKKYNIQEILLDFYDNILPRYKTKKMTVEEAIGNLPGCYPLAEITKNGGRKWSHTTPETDITWHVTRFQNERDIKIFKMLAEDIENGTMSDRVSIPEEIRKAFAPYLKPNPERAAELRELKAEYGQVLPKHFWPNLQLLTTWKCGNTQIYLDKLKGCYPEDMLHQEFAYFSSECRAGLVLDDTIETALFPHMHYYEFKREKDLDDPDAPFYNLYELKEGERYCPYVTTFSGLYRYNMNDIIQIGPAYINAPSFHMVRKANGIVSIPGEKLYEEQFITAVNQAQESTGLKLKYFTGYVNLGKSSYDWYFEFEDRKVNQKRAQAFAEVVDENLKKLNIEYESKRDSFRLKAPSVYLLVPDAFDKFKEFILNINHRDASRFKPNVLAQNEDLHSAIDRFRQQIRTRREEKKKRKNKIENES